METYQLPDLRLPFATAIHPQAQRLQELTEQFCRRFGLLRSPSVAAKFRALGYGGIMATLCPHAPIAGLSLITDWNSFFFITDDQQNIAVRTGRTARYETLVAGMRSVIGGGPLPAPHPLLVALQDLMRRTVTGRSHDWVSRFRADLGLWLSGHLEEDAYRTSGAVPTEESYIPMRRNASTVLPTLDLVELAEDATVPGELHRTRHFQTLILGTADIMCWINDIHSLHMEDGDPINLVTVLEHHLGLRRQEAIDAVAARVAARAGEHLAAARALPETMNRLGLTPQAQSRIMRCVRDQQSWAAGMEIWDRTGTIRFTDVEASYVEDLLGSSP